MSHQFDISALQRRLVELRHLHGALTICTTNVISVTASAVPIHWVHSDLTFADGATASITWRSFVSHADAQTYASQRRRAINKLLRSP